MTHLVMHFIKNDPQKGTQDVWDPYICYFNLSPSPTHHIYSYLFLIMLIVGLSLFPTLGVKGPNIAGCFVLIKSWLYMYMHSFLVTLSGLWIFWKNCNIYFKFILNLNRIWIIQISNYYKPFHVHLSFHIFQLPFPFHILQPSTTLFHSFIAENHLAKLKRLSPQDFYAPWVRLCFLLFQIILSFKKSSIIIRAVKFWAQSYILVNCYAHQQVTCLQLSTAHFCKCSPPPTVCVLILTCICIFPPPHTKMCIPIFLTLSISTSLTHIKDVL